MNKKIKATMLVAAVIAAGFGGIKTYQSMSSTNENLLMQNVEALSAGGDNGSSYGSYQYLGYGCSIWVMKLYCSNNPCHDKCSYHCGQSVN